MNQAEPISLFRPSAIHNESAYAPRRAQRVLAVSLWLAAIGLTAYLNLTTRQQIDWPLLAVFAAAHAISGLLSIRLPGGSYVGFSLTNLASIGLFLGYPQAMIIGLVSPAVVLWLVQAIFRGFRIPRAPRFSIAFESMHTSATYTLATAVTLWLYGQIGGTLHSAQTPLLALLIFLPFGLSSASIVLWQTLGQADLRDLIRRFWPIVVVSHLVSGVAIPVVVVDYYGEGLMALGLTAFALAALLLFMFNTVYLDLLRQVGNLAALNRIGQALSARLELEELLANARREIGKLLDVSGFYLALIDEEKKRITFPIDFEDDEPIVYNDLPLDGKSLSAHIARTRQPFLIASPDREKFMQMGIEPAGRQVKSYAGVPVFSGENVIAVMALRDYHLERAFTLDDLRLMQQIATPLGVALQNARLFHHSQRQATELSSLQEVSSMMTANADLSRLIRAICEIVVDVMGYQKSGVFLLDQARQTTRLVDSVGLSDAYVERSQSVPLDNNRAEVFRTGKPLVVENYMDDPRFAESRELAQAEGIAIVLEVPLMLGQQVIGSVAAYHVRARPIMPNEVSLLQTLGSQIAVAIANARLFESTVERSKELETLYEASATVNASLSLKNVLRALSISAIQALHVPNCTVWLATDDQRALRAALRMTALDGGANEEPIIAITLDLEDMALVQKAIAHQQPAALRIDAADLSAGEQRLLYHCQIASGLALPLVMHNTLHGLIILPPPQADREFDDDETRLAMGLAHQAAVAIDNARRFERTDVALSRRLEEISALERISQRIASHLDLREVIDEVARAALENTGSEYIDVALLDEKTKRVTTLVRRSAIPDHDTPPSWPADQGLTGRAMRARKVVLVSDAKSDPDYIAVRPNVLSEMVTPILLDDRVLGVINLESARLNAFTEDHARFAANLAEHAAIAISNASLYESERRQRQIAELLLETSGIVASSPNLHDVLLTLSEQLLRISGFHGCAILEIDEASGLAYTLAERVHGIWPPGQGQTFSLDAYPATARTLMTGEIAVIHRGMADPDKSELALMASEGVETLIMLPIRVGAQVVGLAELNSVRTDLAVSGYALDNARAALDTAARQLAAPFSANPSARMIELASQLFRAVGGQCACTLSEWDQAAGVVRTLVEFGDLIWQPRRGPSYRIGDYERLASALQAGESAVFHVAEGDKPLNIRSHSQRGAHTLVIQPLTRKGSLIGIVELFKIAEAGTISDEDLRVWRLVADQASVAIENARLFEAIQRSGEEFSALRTVALETASSPDLATTLNIIVRHAQERTGAMDVQIYLYERHHDRLTFGAAARSSSEYQRPVAEPRNDGLTATVARTGERMVATNLAQHPLFKDVVSHPSWKTIKMIMGVPLKSGNEVTGVFNISFDDDRPPDDETLHFLDLLAAQAAIAIENTRLAEATSAGRDRLQAILDSSYDGILMIDPHGHLVMANPRAEYLLNIRLSDKIGWNVLRIVRHVRPTLDADDARLFLKETIRLGRVFEQDNMATTRQQHVLSNPTRAIEVVSTGVQGRDQELVGRLLILHDVTYQFELEAYRQEMSSMIVHDLRSPLSSLITGLDMALSEIEHLPVEANAETLKITLGVGLSSANSLLKLVEGILDVNKLEAGEVMLALAPLNLRDLVQQACDRLGPVGAGASITLSLEMPESLPDIVADHEKIERVVVNLVDNALRYTPQGGRVTVRLKASEQGHQTVSVIDTGEGIPADFRERVFERFFQIDPKGRRRGTRGTGLGLTFCRLAVEAHRGRIWVDGGPEGGAAFHFTLPSNLSPTPSIGQTP